MDPHPNMPQMPEPHTLDPQQVLATRELFWQNVLREILTSLSMVCALRPGGAAGGDAPAGEGPQVAVGEQAPASATMEAVPATPSGPGEIVRSAPDPEGPRFDAQLFDGRLAVITRRGERIPIADVFPLFACGIDTRRERVLSLALECTVFQIRTPVGEVYTLPLHELASFQALTPELMRRLSQMGRRRQERETGEKDVQQPFGFAAFTSLSRETPPPMTESSEQ